MERVKLTISGLRSDITEGLSRKEISIKYGISPGQIKKALDRAGLKGVRAKMDKFELIDDTVDVTSDVVEPKQPEVNDGFTPNYAGMTQASY